jgi:carbamoyltransferase
VYILGLWDGHDAGAALLEDDRIVFASNEERYTKRKLEIKFPYNSIRAALAYAHIQPTDVKVIAFPTTEFAKTLSRVFPFQKEAHYKYRRRKMLRPRTLPLLRFIDYTQKEIGVLPFTGTISKAVIAHHLGSMGFRNFKLFSVDHHASHAATAAFTSGFKKGLAITLDGLGDGLSGSLSAFGNGEMERLGTVSARNSIGIFYEQVTNIVGMRELEDEGKVMAMACYSYPFPWEENRLKSFFKVVDTKIIAKYSPLAQYDMLSRIAWSMPREQFSYMAQQVLEHVLTEFVANAIDEHGTGNIAMAGGLFSNVKANMQVRMLPELKKWFVFPHMGDGGTPMGAAMHINYVLNGVSSYTFNDSYLGDEFSDREIKGALMKEKNINFEPDDDKCSHAGELVSKDNYVFWFQGRMEYGPRALGNRSIIAKAGSEKVKEKLNIFVKQREWYQPFCPSMLEEDAPRLLDDIKGLDRFMTMAYKVKDGKEDVMRSAIHIDNTARPQMVGKENVNFRKVMQRVKKSLGYGVVLNTSFNIHGMPIVMSPEDALLTMKKTKTKHMFLGGYYVENKGA